MPVIITAAHVRSSLNDKLIVSRESRCSNSFYICIASQGMFPLIFMAEVECMIDDCTLLAVICMRFELVVIGSHQITEPHARPTI